MGRYLDEALESGICPKCEKPSSTIDEQFSYGAYAGVMCEKCARSRFGPEGQGNPADLDEPYYEEE